MKLKTCLTSVLLAIGLLACNRDHKKVIGMVPKGTAHVFWQSVHAGAVKAARENDVEVRWNGPASETDINQEVKIIDSMIASHLDAIALAPIDKTALISVVDRATDAKIPVIIFDSPVDTQKFVSQVATDNYAGGEMAAKRMGEILNGKGKVAILAVQVGAASTMAREKGFEDYVQKNLPGIQILDKRYGEADFAISLRAAENILTAHPDLDAMFASNESSAVGAAQALKQRAGTKVKLVGFDAGATLETALRDGIIDSLVVQNPFKMGYESVIAAVKAMKGEAVEKINNMPPRLVVKADLEDPAVKEQLNPDLKKYLE
jgi:ribose transport system substrate-binding protein